MSNAQRVVLIGLAAAIVVASLVLFTPEDDEDTSTAPTQASEPAPTAPRTATAKPQPPRPLATRIVVRGGQPGGVKRVTVKRGDTVRLVVSSDEPQQVHVHGYDLLKGAAPGRPARFAFEADVEGVFEVELEGSHTQIAKLEVRPA